MAGHAPFAGGFDRLDADYSARDSGSRKCLGEWSPHDLANQALPAGVPHGLERLSSVWTAPFPSYSPPFLRSSSFGYFLSAAFGTGLILLAALVVDWVIAARRRSG